MRIKKIYLILAILLFTFVISVHAETSGYEIAISSSKDTYDLGETAIFEVTITKEGHSANLEALDIVASFAENYVFPSGLKEGTDNVLVFNIPISSVHSPISPKITILGITPDKLYNKADIGAGDVLPAITVDPAECIWSMEPYTEGEQITGNGNHTLSVTAQALTVLQEFRIVLYHHNRKYMIELLKQAKEADDAETIAKIQEYIENAQQGSMWEWENPEETTEQYGDILISANDISMDIGKPIAEKSVTVDILGKTAEESVSFVIDIFPPEINITTPVTDGTTEPTIPVAGTVSNDTVSVTINNEPVDELIVPDFSLSGVILSEGENIIKVKATDKAGNSSEKSITVTMLISEPIDSDGDGLTDEEELDLGLDPEDRDSDNDKLNDGKEIELGSDPLAKDTDEDGINDGDEEYEYGSNPCSEDTDEDGLSDFQEIFNAKTSPTKADTDLDTLNDKDEIVIHQTNPNSIDTDEDGTSDNEELAAGTNPQTFINDAGEEVTDYLLSEITASSGVTSATIHIVTQLESRITIEYDQTPQCKISTAPSSWSSIHAIVLENLKPGTVYNYIVNAELKQEGYENSNFLITTAKPRLFLTHPSTGETIAPEIEILFPENNGTTSDPLLTISGTTDDYFANLQVEGATKIIQKDGNFWIKDVPLIPGLNQVTIVASDNFSNTSETTVQITYDPDSLPKITSTNVEDNLPYGLPEQIKGTWEGTTASIFVNGKACVVYTDGTWEGPSVISPIEATALNITSNDEAYLIVDDINIIPLIFTIDSNGTPIDKAQENE